jgi:hypothetical protein
MPFIDLFPMGNKVNKEKPTFSLGNMKKKKKPQPHSHILYLSLKKICELSLAAWLK